MSLLHVSGAHVQVMAACQDTIVRAMLADMAIL